MKVKLFDFPTFEVWKKHAFIYRGRVGEYFVEIRATSWGTRPDAPETNYSIAVSTRENPMNIYSPTMYKELFSYKHDNEDNLKNWYEEQTKKFNEFWEKFILRSYFEN